MLISGARSCGQACENAVCLEERCTLCVEGGHWDDK
jgi:hypothetical protein